MGPLSSIGTVSDGMSALRKKHQEQRENDEEKWRDYVVYGVIIVGIIVVISVMPIGYKYSTAETFGGWTSGHQIVPFFCVLSIILMIGIGYYYHFHYDKRNDEGNNLDYDEHF